MHFDSSSSSNKLLRQIAFLLQKKSLFYLNINGSYKLFLIKSLFFFLQDFVRGQTLWSYLFIHTFPSYHSANHRDVRMIVVSMKLQELSILYISPLTKAEEPQRGIDPGSTGWESRALTNTLELRHKYWCSNIKYN